MPLDVDEDLDQFKRCEGRKLHGTHKAFGIRRNIYGRIQFNS